MKIGVSSYSYQRLLNSKEKTMFDVVEHAKKTGFDYIEFIDLKPEEGKDIKEYAKELKAHCDKVGLGIAAYTVHADFLYGCDGDSKKEVERVKGCVDVAEILGVDRMRHDSAWTFNEKRKDYKDAIDIVAPLINEVSEYAKTKNIKTMCENHGRFMQDSNRMVELVKAVGNDNFGLLVDMGNFLCADEEPTKAVSNAAPYAFHAHVKDFLYKDGGLEKPSDSWFESRHGNYLRGTIAGHGVVPIKQCIKILQNAGYDDILSLEFEGCEENLFAIEEGYKFIKKSLT